MRIADVREDYEQTVGWMVRDRESSNGKQP
jgi:hypothetical protein